MKVLEAVSVPGRWSFGMLVCVCVCVCVSARVCACVFVFVYVGGVCLHVYVVWIQISNRRDAEGRPYIS